VFDLESDSLYSISTMNEPNTVYDLKSKLVVSKELQLRIETVVLECLTMAQKKWGEDKVNKIPDIRYDTVGKAAGQALYNFVDGKCYIRINPVLLNENVDYCINQTVPHEIAHLVAYMVFGRVRPHGIHWEAVMRTFGKPAKRCHQLSTDTIQSLRSPRRQTRMMKCLCPKCNATFPITRNKATKMYRGWSYTHVGCGGRLAYKDVIGSSSVDIGRVIV
jgi:SprT protein